MTSSKQCPHCGVNLITYPNLSLTRACPECGKIMHLFLEAKGFRWIRQNPRKQAAWIIALGLSLLILVHCLFPM